ncbi:DUF5667 domain-containing protein [Dethiobacter alkaliphilus]|uniref:DUF5667 domain-containing protein n=1 Tax=Dethiobacter alkaliphilus TaxID=427926 RepID=UPI002226D98D|nr:DUF5667 domain-containing protein [Dethiobacter alkaliphilus]MCW3489738.1 DUF5667 domain-containing protein [Dethiobacter alkaliphilus]
MAVAPVAAGTAEAVEDEGGIIAVETLEAQEDVLTPDSPFYFFKRFIEEVRLILTFDQETKIALLDELAEERAKELAALESMYEDGELSDKQLATLENALDDLIIYTERLVDELVVLDVDDGKTEEKDEGEETPDSNGTQDDGDTEDPDAPKEGDAKDIDGDEGESAEDELEPELDKYQWRIAHLQSIADRAPEAAQNGLARAMLNAERQRERAIEKGKIPADDTEGQELEKEDSENVDLENGDYENEEAEGDGSDIADFESLSTDDQATNVDLENNEPKQKDREDGETVKSTGPPPWANGNANGINGNNNGNRNNGNGNANRNKKR